MYFFKIPLCFAWLPKAWQLLANIGGVPKQEWITSRQKHAPRNSIIRSGVPYLGVEAISTNALQNHHHHPQRWGSVSRGLPHVMVFNRGPIFTLLEKGNVIYLPSYSPATPLRLSTSFGANLITQPMGRWGS